MNWEPARADHSIDRVVASISLLEPIGADDFDQLVLRGRKAARDHQLVDRVDLPDMIAPPPGSDGVFIGLDNFKPSRRVVFKRTDANGAAVDELSISMQQLSFSTLRYRRWPNFFHFITSTVAALDQDYPITQRARLVRLEYVDRFQSAPEGADHFEVISKDSVFLAPIVRDKTAALHVHSGWFDFETPNIRKLTNVNVDVNDISIPLPPPSEQRRKISILSMGQFEALAGSLDRPPERLDTLHDYLKDTFRNIITPEAASRVALND
ncbi:MAG: TIGR04255 family protein [Methylocella sp.]